MECAIENMKLLWRIDGQILKRVYESIHLAKNHETPLAHFLCYKHRIDWTKKCGWWLWKEVSNWKFHFSTEAPRIINQICFFVTLYCFNYVHTVLNCKTRGIFYTSQFLLNYLLHLSSCQKTFLRNMQFYYK